MNTIPDATSQADVPAEDSVDAAANAFEGLLRPKPDKKPSEKAPESELEPELEEQPEEQPDEDTGAEPEVEADPESTDEVTDEVAEEEPAPTVKSRKLKMPDGTEREVSEDEAYNGFLMQADYTRKTQAVAEEVKTAKAEQATAREERTRYAAQLEQVKRAMDTMVPKEPDWASLRAKLSPQDYAATLADWQQFSTNRAAVEAEQQSVAAAQKADYDKDFTAFREAEVEKLLTAVPEWRDGNAAEAARVQLATYARSANFSDEEANAVVDHRVILLFRKAMLWDQLQAAKPKVQAKVKDSIKSAPAGSSAPAPVTSDEKRAKATLATTGRVQDAAGVFRNLLKPKKAASRK